MPTYGLGKDLLIVVRAARVMLQNGAETYRVEDTAQYLANRLGFRVQSSVTPTGIFITAEDDEHNTVTRIKSISSRSFDLSKLDAVNTFSRDFDFSAHSWEEVMDFLGEIDLRVSHYPRWFILFCAGLASGGFALILGGDVNSAAIAVVAGIGAIFSAGIFAKQQFHIFLGSFLGGLTAMLIATILCRFFPQADANSAIIGAVMPLVPGVAITSAARDLAMGHLISGLARAGEAVMVAFAIAAGVVLKYFM